jgi:outer membrane receptor protein involved in Fe transport
MPAAMASSSGIVPLAFIAAASRGARLCAHDGISFFCGRKLMVSRPPSAHSRRPAPFVKEVRVRHRLSTVLLVAVSFLGGASAFAQRTTGGIVGIVSDESRAVLPGATVTVSGEKVMGAPEAVTDGQGKYRFPSLAPGLYELNVRLTGFSPARRTELRVQVGTTTEENVTLKVAALTETVEVEASGAVVDTQSSQVGTNYDREWVENAPILRKSFFDILASAPGVDPTFNQRFPAPGSFGSFGDQNLFQLDGTDLTDSFNAGIGSATLVQPSVDIVEEVQILSLGAPAEYGGVQGAVFNFATRQGSNVFHGGASFYYQGDGLTGRNTTPEEECGTKADCLAAGGLPFTRLEYKDASFQLGGPIKKDRLWFFGAYDHVRDSFVNVGIRPGTADRTKTDHGFGKLNFQLSPRHNFVSSLTFEHRVLDAGLLPNQAPSRQNSRDRRIFTPSLAYTGTLSDATVLDVRYAGFYSVNKGGAAPGAKRIVGGRVFINFDTGEQTGDPFGYYEYHLSRTAVNAKLSHHASDFLGASHDFKFGVQFNTSPATGESSYSDYIFTYTYAGNPYTLVYNYSPFTYAATARTVGAYVDDSVRIGNRLTLNLGLRYERTRTGGDETPQLDPITFQPTGFIFPKVDFFSWNTVSPRLGFNLKLTADGRTVLKGHYGRYHPGGSIGNLIQPRSQAPVFGGTFNFATGQYENVYLIRDSSNIFWDPETPPSTTDQYIVSLERELFGQLNLSASFIHKRTRDLLGWLDEGGRYETLTHVDDMGPEATGESFDVFKLVSPSASRRLVLQAPPGTRSRYTGLTVGATKRMSSKWQLTASATFGKATRNRTNGTTSTQNFQGFGQNPNDYVNSHGLSPLDRDVVFKTQVLYAGLPWGVSVSANYTHAAGYPYRRGTRVQPIGRNVPAAPLTDDKRFPSLNVLDLRLQKDVKLGGRARVSLFVNAFNLFNNDAYQAFQDHLGTSEAFRKPADFILPRRAMLGAKLDF